MMNYAMTEADSVNTYLQFKNFNLTSQLVWTQIISPSLNFNMTNTERNELKCEAVIKLLQTNNIFIPDAAKGRRANKL